MSSSSASSSGPQAERQIVDDVLRVFVAFDPGCAESCSHARSLYKYLQGGDLDEVQGWTPVPVRYLCSAEALAAHEPAAAEPGSGHQNDVLVVMISAAMLRSPAWRRALWGLKRSPAPTPRWVYPVTLTGDRSEPPSLSDGLDPLRVWTDTDGAMPEGAGAEAWIDRRFARLRRALADALLRDLGDLGRGGRRPASVRHAQRSVAERRAAPPGAPPKVASPTAWVAISGGGVNSELYAAGIGEEHNHDLMVLLTRLIASRGLGVAYGGSLRAPSADNLVDGLLYTARAWRSAELPPEPARMDGGRFVRNYVAMGFHEGCTEAVRAASRALCAFILVDAEGQARPQWSDTLPAETATHRKRDALSAMRRLSTEETDARVMFGGKINGGPDWMPGVAEELLCSLERGQPVALLSGFGGVAAVLAKALRGLGPPPTILRHPRADALAQLIEAHRADPGAFALTIIDEADPTRAVAAVGAFLDGLPPPGPKPEGAPAHVWVERAPAGIGGAS